MLRKIIFRVLLIIVLFASINLVYTKWFYKQDVQKHSDIINLVHNIPKHADIIYIGESSNGTYAKSDFDKRPISAFIGDYYPELGTYDITKAATHAGIYKVLLKKIPFRIR